jgi:hypothetical protein
MCDPIPNIYLVLTSITLMKYFLIIGTHNF